MKTKFKELIKFNGGLGAILCKNCSKIIRTGESFTWLEKSYLNLAMDICTQRPIKERLDKLVKDSDEYICDECKNTLNM